MNKEQIIDEAYVNYLENCLDIKWMKENFFYDGSSNHHVYRIIKESFIRKCKTDSDFSEKWGLKIEERELSLDERNEIRDIQYFKNNLHQALKGSDTKIDWENIPTKLITITYKDTIIESYE